MGKQVLITTFGSLGDLHPYLALAIGLKARGHAPVIATSELYREVIEQDGIGFHPVRPDIDPNDRELIKKALHPRLGPEFLIREVLLPHLRDSYQDLASAVDAADLLITHPITFAGPLAAQVSKTPWVSTVLAPLSLFSAYDLPVFPNFPFLKKLDQFGPWMGRLLLRFAKTVTRKWSEPIWRLRAELSLPPTGDPLYEGQFSPHMVLGLFSPLLAKPAPDWPQNTRLTGFLFYDQPDHLLTDSKPEELEPDCRLTDFLRSGPPPAVFTLGSSAAMAAGDFYKISVEAVRVLGIRAVLVGKDQSVMPGEKLSDEIAVFEYIPYRKIFPASAMIVHQGGIGTTAQALRSGKPMLVVPFAFDQPDNAYRVERLGLARTLYRHKYSVDRLVRELTVLLKDPGYSKRSEEAGRIIRAEDGVAAACEAIEKVLRNS